MKPKPLVELKNFTVPIAIVVSLSPGCTPGGMPVRREEQSGGEVSGQARTGASWVQCASSDRTIAGDIYAGRRGIANWPRHQPEIPQVSIAPRRPGQLCLKSKC